MTAKVFKTFFNGLLKYPFAVVDIVLNQAYIRFEAGAA